MKNKILLLACITILLAAGAEKVLGEAPAETAAEVKVPVVMYHLVTERQKYIGKYGITPAELRADLEYLRDNSYDTVVMQDLINFVDHGTPLPPNPIMLTFDDGNYSDFEYLLPLLREFDKKAVVAIISGAADKYTKMEAENPKGRYPNLSWPQVKLLHESGHVEIQNHSHDLHGKNGSGKRKGETAEAYYSRLFADLKKMQDGCKSNLNGYSPTAFVYPLGVIGEGSQDVLTELGLRGSFSCQEGINVIRQGDRDCLFLLKRTNRPSGRGIENIAKKY